MQIRHLPNRDHRRTASPFSSSHQPMGHVFFTGFPTEAGPPISERPLPSVYDDSTECFYRAQAGPNPEQFFSTSLLSYKLGSSCAKLEPLPVTSFMTCSGGGRIGSLLVVMDR